MEESINLAEFAVIDNPANYLAQRKSFVDKSNNRIKVLTDEIRNGLEEKMTIYVVPFKAEVSYPSKSSNKYLISTIELHHIEVMQEIEHRAVDGLKICCECKKLSDNEEGTFGFDRWVEFNDDELKFGSSVYFSDKNEYLKFKKIVISLKELYPSR